MKVYAAGLLTALVLVMLLASGAQASMQLYVEDSVLERAQAQRLLMLLDDGETQWTLSEGNDTLWELVLAGKAPDLAICSPQSARPWAMEGMLLALHHHIGSQQRMQREVLSQCVEEETMFMAPLIARHRQMAVNGRLMDEMGLGYMLDSQTYPVWYPAQFYQILEEFMIHDATALDVWRADMEHGAAIEALAQAIYGGMLLGEDGETCQADDAAILTGVQWLADAVDDGMIGYCQTREEALKRFLDGETAIFLDWTDGMDAEDMQIEVRPYPSAIGLPVRSYDLVGVCAFKSGDAQRDAKLVNACVRLHEGVQDVLGQRGIWQDGAVWLPGLEAAEGGATLRSLFCTALQDVMEGRMRADDALERVQTAMDALIGAK